MAEKNSKDWEKVGDYGEGEIFAKDNERKIVTLGREDFYYKFDKNKDSEEVAE